MLMRRFFCSNREREASGHSLSVPRGAGWPAPTRCSGRCWGHVAGAGSTGLWGFQTLRKRVASLLASRGAEGAPFAGAGPATGAVFEALPGGHGRTADPRPLSGSAHAALCALDPRGRAGSPCATLRDVAVGLDGGSLPPALRLSSPEPFAPRLRARPRGGASLVEETLSSDPGVGSSGEGNDLLGRRDGQALGSSRGALLGSPWPDTRHARHRKEISL